MLIVATAMGAFAAWYRPTRWRPRATPAREVPGQAVRVQVELLNATNATGLSRLATGRLRDAGLDVVYFGNDTLVTLDSTEILVRRGDDAGAERVRRALGAGAVRTAPDSARMVDVTVRLGRDFATLVRQP